VYLVIALLAPGLIIIFVRSRFITGRIAPHSEATLSYLVASIIYYALTLPLVEYVLTFREPGYSKALAWFGLEIVGPAFCGLALGMIAQKGIGQRCLKFLRLHVVHASPTAWDYKFGNMPAQWVLVTLKNGTQFAGYYGRNSLASSDVKERDVYIELLYDVDDHNVWTERQKDAGILIAAGEISTINFWHD